MNRSQFVSLILSFALLGPLFSWSPSSAEEVEDQEGGYGDHSNIKVINFTKEAMEGGKGEKTSQQEGGELPP